MRVKSRPTTPAAAAALLMALATSSATGGPVEVLRDCASSAPKATRGIDKLAAACPDLSNALQSLGMDKLLINGWRENLTPQALNDVAELSSRYETPQKREGPHVASLHDIVEAVNGTPAPVTSWWQRLNSWLREWLAHRGSQLTSWLSQWLAELSKSPSLLKVAALVCVTLIVAAAVAVIFNELRTAGIWRRRGFRRARRGADATPTSSRAEVLSRAGPDGATELLRQLVTRLTEAGRLGNERSLTHRELIVRSRLDTEEQREILASVAHGAEQVTYGTGQSAQELRALIESGRTLLAQLGKEPA